MVTHLGEFNEDEAPLKSSYGVFYRCGHGWYARLYWYEVGPFDTAEEAEAFLVGIEEVRDNKPGFASSYGELAKRGAMMLLAASLLLAGAWAFVWLVWAALDN